MIVVGIGVVVVVVVVEIEVVIMATEADMETDHRVDEVVAELTNLTIITLFKNKRSIVIPDIYHLDLQNNHRYVI